MVETEWQVECQALAFLTFFWNGSRFIVGYADRRIIGGRSLAGAPSMALCKSYRVTLVCDIRTPREGNRVHFAPNHRATVAGNWLEPLEKPWFPGSLAISRGVPALVASSAYDQSRESCGALRTLRIDGSATPRC
jgi:hypothetical protein